MKKFNLPLISDVLFTAAAAFLLFFTAIRHYTRSAYIALPFAVAAALLSGALAYLLISGKQKKNNLVYSNARERELLKTHLSLLSKNRASKLVLPCLDDGARVERYRICADERVYYPMFTFENLTKSDIAAVIKRKTDRQKVVLCNGCAPDAESLAERFGIAILRTDDMFDKLKSGGFLPEKYLYEDAVKPSVIKIIKRRFNKKLTPPLFLSGLSLIVLSYFTFFPVYYIASGGLLIVLALAALFIS